MTDHTSIRLIVRGDDGGAFRAGNQAIVDAFRNGILRCASLMIPAPQILHAAQLMKDEPGLCLGLHVTLTSEWASPRWGPVSPPETVPTLIDEDNYFYRTPMDLYERGVNIEEVVREIRAQLGIARALGLNIRYLDEHMGIGWVFHPADKEKKRIGDVFRALALQEGLIWHGDGDRREIGTSTLEELQTALCAMTAGEYVLITHPALDDQEMQQIVGSGNDVAGQVAQARARDYQMLCHPSVIKIIRERKIMLACYDDGL